MVSAWVRQQDRKRSLVAAGSTLCLYALAFGLVWLLSLMAPVTLASVPSTVIVDLGGAEGAGGQVPLGLPNAPDRPAGAPPGAAPLPAAGSEAAAAKESPNAATTAALPQEAPVPAAKSAAPSAAKPAPAAKAAGPKAGEKTIPEKSAEQIAAEAAAAQAAQERAAAEDAAVQAAAATAQAQSSPAKTKTFGSSSSGSGSGSGGAPVAAGGNGSGSEPGVAGGTGCVTFRGSEMGSSLATTFGASSGQVGRNIYVPIYLYMPLPQKVPDEVYRNIAAKGTFRSYYEQSDSGWALKAKVPVSQRGDVWTMLEAAGYDPATADFKAGRKLNPVVLEFAVGPVSRNKTELVDVRLVSSSGSPEVDEAVVYGFRQASFFNKTGFAVGGKFVYGF